jgi:hypothetical protein
MILRHLSVLFAARPRNLLRRSYGWRYGVPLRAAGQVPHPNGSPRLARWDSGWHVVGDGFWLGRACYQTSGDIPGAKAQY